MALRIVTADERLAVANAKTTVAIFGPAGAGKTSLARTLPPDETVVIDLEAGWHRLYNGRRRRPQPASDHSVDFVRRDRSNHQLRLCVEWLSDEEGSLVVFLGP